jgi:hypothetical protein
MVKSKKAKIDKKKWYSLMKKYNRKYNTKVSKTNTMKKRCYKLLNPWHDILSQGLLKNPKKYSKNQHNIWCKIHKNAKKTHTCVREADTKNEFKLSKWDKFCQN